jgi:hypothetical protein
MSYVKTLVFGTLGVAFGMWLWRLWSPSPFEWRELFDAAWWMGSAMLVHWLEYGRHAG